MKKTDFYYDLPPELIAQTPIPERDHSRKATAWSSMIPVSSPPGCLATGQAGAPRNWFFCGTLAEIAGSASAVRAGGSVKALKSSSGPVNSVQ